MVVCVDEADVEQTLAILAEQNETAYRIGHIAASDNAEPMVIINP